MSGHEADALARQGEAVLVSGDAYAHWSPIPGGVPPFPRVKPISRDAIRNQRSTGLALRIWWFLPSG
jgi:hypothetical protein